MSAIGSLFGSNAQNVPVSTYQQPGMTGAATDTLGQTSQLAGTNQNLWQQYLPQLQNLLGTNTAGGQAGAQVAGGLAPGGVQLGTSGQQGGQQLQDAWSSTIPYAQQLLNTGFDPQNALYNRTAQQVQDQQRVASSAAGVGTTPYGAGVEGQTMSNFNIDWLNNLLGRQTQATGAAGTLLGQAGTGMGQAQQVGQQGAQGAVQSAMLPYATMSAADTLNTGALNQGIGASTAASQPTIQDLLAYLQTGNQANQIYNTGQIGGTQATTQQQNTGFNQLGTLGNTGFGLAGLFAGV